MATWHDQKVKAGDELNAYMTAPNREKIWAGLDSEFGDYAGKFTTIVRAPYGQKKAGLSFRAHFEQYICRS